MPPEEMDWVGIQVDIIRPRPNPISQIVFPGVSPAVTVSFSSSFTATSTAPDVPRFENTATLTSTVTPLDYFGQLDHDVFLHSSLTSYTNQELANGRSRGYTTK